MNILVVTHRASPSLKVDRALVFADPVDGVAYKAPIVRVGIGDRVVTTLQVNDATVSVGFGPPDEIGTSRM